MIPIQNIYHMLAYAFQNLQTSGYRELATESFENMADLCAAILCIGTSRLIKQGLGRDYIDREEQLTALRGKINLSASIRNRSMLRNQMVCNYDDYSVNHPLNQILKATMILLLHGNIARERKKEIRRLLVYFAEVDQVDVHSLPWNTPILRNNEQYRMLTAICHMVVKDLLQTTKDGKTRLTTFLDEQRMNRLYEKFLLEYYRKHYPELQARSARIPWALDDEENSMLPQMQSDIMLTQGNRVLIIDAKYYASTTQQRYDARTVHSHNMYQIFTYVKNKEAELAGQQDREVSGMLLYARTDEKIQPDYTYHMSGNRISVKTLDLNCDFKEIREQLNELISHL